MAPPETGEHPVGPAAGDDEDGGDAPVDPAPLVFVGGTGRSGTHIVSKLISKNVRYGLVPVEVRFHTDDDGFPGLLRGDVTKQQFLKRLRGYWWKGFQTNRMRGMHRFVERETFDEAVERFDAGFEADPDGACRRLFFDLLWSRTERADADSKLGIIEQSCDTVAEGEVLARLFPEARFIHVVRDGRDASASRVSQTKGVVYPRTRVQGIEWWEQRIRAIDAGARAIPAERLLEIELSALLRRGRRKRTLKRVARFVGVRPGEKLRRFLRRRMNSEAANEQRWRRGLSTAEQEEIERLYLEALDRLEADGISCVPLLREAYEAADAARPGSDDDDDDARSFAEEPDELESGPHGPASGRDGG